MKAPKADWLLTQNFLFLVLIALVIATPLAWYLMRKWLQDFSYGIDISWDVFVIAGAISVFIAIVTVSFQAIKAATDNPVKALQDQ